MLSACSAQSLESEVEPYLDYLGGDASAESITLPADLYEDSESVEFLGKEGTVSYAQSLGNSFLDDYTVDELTWESNDKVTHEEYDQFMEVANEYFGYEYEEVEVLSDPCQRWEDSKSEYMVTASYQGGNIRIAWQLE